MAGKSGCLFPQIWQFHRFWPIPICICILNIHFVIHILFWTDVLYVWFSIYIDMSYHFMIFRAIPFHPLGCHHPSPGTRSADRLFFGSGAKISAPTWGRGGRGGRGWVQVSQGARKMMENYGTVAGLLVKPMVSCRFSFKHLGTTDPECWDVPSEDYSHVILTWIENYVGYTSLGKHTLDTPCPLFHGVGSSSGCVFQPSPVGNLDNPPPTWLISLSTCSTCWSLWPADPQPI
jgi:hypothetical protein